jgi:tight adherence protein C
MFETLNIETLLETARSSLALRFGEITFSPAETSVLVLALAAALTSGLNLLRISRHENRQGRLGMLRGTPLDAAPTEQRRGPRWYHGLGNAVAASRFVGIAEQQRLLGALAAAGIKRHGDLAIFVAGKVCSALALAALFWLLVEQQQLFIGMRIIRLALLVCALMVGWRLPDFVLSRLAARRRRWLEDGIPDALDLLVICAEAGLSLDQAVEEVSRTLRPSNAAVSDEFAATAAEMRVLTNRGEALENLVKRTGLASLRSITATLNQAIRFGTPLAESMRTLAAEMRTLRLARIEERAARLPVLLAIPLMMFILPSLFMVIGAPVALRVMDALRQTFSGHQ